MTTGDLELLNDDELAERARKTRASLMRLPRNHVNRDSYIMAWRLTIDEMNRRSLPSDSPHDGTLAMRQPGNSGFAPGDFYPTNPPAA